MITYNVNRKSRSRITFRIIGISFSIVGITQIFLFFMNHGKNHLFGTFLCFIILCYGIYLFVHSFAADFYNISYEFNDDNFIIHENKKTRTFRYEEITGFDHIIPENEYVYSIIHLTVQKHDYIIPFSYKKDICDKIYAYINERITTKTLESDKIHE